MSDQVQVVEPTSRCGACGQTDDHPKHSVHVGINTEAAGGTFHPHDEDRDGLIHYHFDCPSDWHDLFARLPTTAFESPDPEKPWLAWEDSSAMEHRIVATRHAAIVAKARGGTRGEELRAWIAETHALAQGPDTGGATMMAGGMDQTMANAVLDALGPNSGTTTVGAKTITGPLHLRLITTTTLSTDTTNGSELSGGSYPTGGSAIAFAAAATGSKATNASVSFTGMPACTLSGVEEWDTSGTPQRTLWGPWAGGNLTISGGSTLTVASGSLTNSLA